MKRLIGIVLLLIMSVSIVYADEDLTEQFRVVVDPESVLIRALPSLEGEFIASAFRSDVLVAVGRNLDGTWFLVRRPSRMSNLGWISHTVIDFDFLPETLPLLDFSTGARGNFVLTRDPGTAAFTLAEVNLRVQPQAGTEVITRAPFGVVLPILERDRSLDWFLVTYLGTTGWVNINNLRGIAEPQDVPIAVGLPEIPIANTLIIPLNIQLNEIEEFRIYVTAQNNFSIDLKNYWTQVMGFEVMPCEPPPFVTNYLFTRDDERAFPELEFLVLRLDTATNFINTSIEPMYECGVKSTTKVVEAKNAATNAGIIYASTLSTIDSIQVEITANR